MPRAPTDAARTRSRPGRKPQSTEPTPAELIDLPGHYIRRLQQIAVAIFLEETGIFGITPVQFAALDTVRRQPMLDQRTLARSIGFDTSTIAGVVDRLERRSLLVRNTSADDRRVRLLALTAAGEALLAAVRPATLKAQQRILEPLSPADQARFMAMLRVLVQANNALSRAPSDGG